MKLIFAALALGSLAAPAAAHPIQAAQTAPDLDRLVALLVPEARMIDIAMKGLETATPDPAIAALYAANPATKPYVEAQVRPELQRVLQRELPALRTQIAAILTAQLTPSEVTDATVFFASPTGQKLYAAAIGSLAGGKPDMTEAESRDAAMQAAMASLTPDDYPALMAFSASNASKKMGAINPQIGTASKAWAARVIAENGERMHAIALRAAQEFQKNKGAAQ